MADDALARARAEALVGRVLSERYRIIELCATGAMGAVYRGEHLLMRKDVAIKVLHSDVEDLPELVARFQCEAVAGAHISHPNVASASDFGKFDGGSYFLVLELIRGVTVREALEAGPMPTERAVRIARQLAEALGAAHDKGIIHRDLKPRNVMLVDGTDDTVKLIDFGFARVRVAELRPNAEETAGQGLTTAGVVFGTVGYVAPEIVFGMEAVDERSDLYVLGVILYEMLAGKPPFDAPDMRKLLAKHRYEKPPAIAQLNPEVRVPASVEAVVMRLLAKEPADRYACARDVVAALDEAMAAAGRGASAGATAAPATAVPASAATTAAATTAAATTAAATEEVRRTVEPSTTAAVTALAETADEEPALPEARTATARRRRGYRWAIPLLIAVLVVEAGIFVVRRFRPTAGVPSPSTSSDLAMAAAPSVEALSTPPTSIATAATATANAGATVAAAATANADTTAAAAATANAGANAAAAAVTAAAPDAEPSAAPAGTANDAAAPEAAGGGHSTERAKAARARLLRLAEVKDATGAGKALLELAEADAAAFKDADVRRAAANVAVMLETRGGTLADKVYYALTFRLGATGLDVLYAIIESGKSTRASQRATQILRQDAVFARASTALKIAFELRRTGCKHKAPLFERAAREGDERALMVLDLLSAPQCSAMGCCYRHNEQLEAAARALREKAP